MSLRGARLQRVDAPLATLLALSLHSEGRARVLLLGLDSPARGLGLVDERPRGLPASSFVQLLRRELEGGRVAELERSERWLRLGVRRGEGIRWLAIRRERRRDFALFVDEAGNVRGANEPHRIRELGLKTGDPIPWEAARFPFAPVDPAELDSAGEGLQRAALGAALEGRRRTLLKRLGRALRRAERKVRAIEGDARRIEEVPHLRREGGLILGNLHALGARDRLLRCMDWELDPPAEVEIAIDGALGAKGHAERLFHRARRLERGASVAAKRAQMAQREVEALRSLRAEAESAEDEPALDDAIAEAESLGIAASAGGGPRRQQQAARLPFRRFVSAEGRAILVGRGAADNDTLTLRHSKPGYHWLHARGRTGAHVIVPLQKGESVPSELLIDAATLAAHFSDARGEPLVEVQHTARRHVHKRRGSAPGAVVVEREKVFALRLEGARLSRLLSNERREKNA